VRTLTVMTVAVIFLQLIVGAAMRHTAAGLAIPDFPLAFGKLIPPFDRPGVAIHFAHRVGALIVAACVLFTVARIWTRHRDEPALTRPAAFLAALLVLQVALGATTVWTRKSVLPTTFHVLCGALLLATSLVLALRAAKHVAAPVRAQAFVPCAPERVGT
jgi:cytochrome c oxidase assembly protein subunit 15